MGIPVLVLGQSGTGKSYSLKNFAENEICLISVQKSLLPFRKKFEEVVVTDSYRKIRETLRATDKKKIVIDDTQYLMANEFMRRATERGYDKFTEIAQNFWSLIVEEVNTLPSDTIVYLLCHTSTDENGVEKMKTIGKLVDEKITPEGLFTIVLKTVVSDGKYAFVTQNNGKDTVKSPEGMFTTYAINNDLKYVDEKIRNYYELGEGFLTDSEIAEIDEAAKNVDIEPPKPKEERKRRNRTEGKDEPDTKEEPKPLRERKKRGETPVETPTESEDIDPDSLPFTMDEPTPTEEEKPVRRRRRASAE